MFGAIRLVIICLGFITSLLGRVKLEVPLIYQYPDFPTGCETVATVEMLQYLGYDIEVDEFIDNYLDTIAYDDSRIADFENVFDYYFVGNPRSYSGFLCNPPVIVDAVNKYFSKLNVVLASPVDLTGTSLRNLLDYVSDGYPVVIWLTIDYVEPTKKELYSSSYYTPSHTVVISGYDTDANEVYIVDSISGHVVLDYSHVKDLYDAVGRKSFTVR